MTDLFANVLYKDHYGPQSIVNGLLEGDDRSEASAIKHGVQGNITQTKQSDEICSAMMTLRKGQKVTLRSGKTVIVEGFSENYFWTGKEALPYWKGEIGG